MEEKTQERIKRNKEKKHKSVGKVILAIIAMIVVALAAFFVTIKICKPDFDIKSFITSGASQFVDKLSSSDTTKEQITTVIETTTQTTTKKYYNYAEFSDFEFDTSKQGNQVGNLLNKTQGAITYDSSYIYFSKPGSGIYRFAPGEETNSKLTSKVKNARCLNIVGEYLYFINTDTSELVKFNSSMESPQVIASDIAMCYAYNENIYYISNTGGVGYITVSEIQNVPLYTPTGGNTVNFVGISLSRIFFTVTDTTAGDTSYVSVSLSDSNDVQEFRETSYTNQILSMELENGFFYYYEQQDDSTYDLIRQKFGSDKKITILEDCSITDYPVVCNNRLYYTAVSDTGIDVKEYNMNSEKKRVMVSQKEADSTGSIAVGYGYQYIFLIGTKTADGESVYKGSGLYTSSSKDNTMTFKDGKWKY